MNDNNFRNNNLEFNNDFEENSFDNSFEVKKEEETISKEEKIRLWKEKLERKKKENNENNENKKKIESHVPNNFKPSDNKVATSTSSKQINLKIRKNVNKRITFNKEVDKENDIKLVNKKFNIEDENNENNIENNISIKENFEDKEIEKENKKEIEKEKELEEIEKIKEKEEKINKLRESKKKIVKEENELKKQKSELNEDKDIDLDKSLEEIEEYNSNIISINEIKYDNKDFFLHPVSKTKLFQTTIIREKKLFKNTIYHLYFYEYDSNYDKLINKHHLLSAKKMSGNVSSNYLISIDKKIFNRKHDSCLGKLRSNLVGTEFKLFDKGENPKKKFVSDENIRNQLGYIEYEKNIFGGNGPRKFSMIFPKYKNGEYIKIKPKNKEDDIKRKIERGDNKNFNLFINKSPVWNKEIQSYVLNFYGRVDVPSIKNFQLIKKKNINKEVQIIELQFGRIAEAEFNLDFNYPFSPLQAFAIALSSCDNKLFCE